MERTDPYSWVAHVELKADASGKAQLYIDGKEVKGLLAYRIEQDRGKNWNPVLTMSVVCDIDMSTDAIPVLPEPWTWFYEPKIKDFVNMQHIKKADK